MAVTLQMIYEREDASMDWPWDVTGEGSRGEWGELIRSRINTAKDVIENRFNGTVVHDGIHDPESLVTKTNLRFRTQEDLDAYVDYMVTTPGYENPIPNIYGITVSNKII